MHTAVVVLEEKVMRLHNVVPLVLRQMLNLERKKPKECEGTGVDRQDDDDDEGFDGRILPQSV